MITIENINIRLSLDKFIKLKSQELFTTDENKDSIKKLKLCTQSIYHLYQYCEYHYVNIKDAATKFNLRLDRISIYRREGETVPIRFVYEANIAAFLHSLHALLDSLPYLLSIFITKNKNLKPNKIGWNEDFIKLYKSEDFHEELINFFIDDTFNKVKGYINTIKHRHIIRISNYFDRLEFEKYTYIRRYKNKNGEIDTEKEVVVKSQNIISFIETCHDELISKLFKLYNNILNSKQVIK